MTSDKNGFFEKMAEKITCWTGSPAAFSIALLVVILWGITGPIFNFSETWQLIINTGTTIVTFLMVFLIQKAQNKDSKAIQLKLNELIAANKFTSNRMVDIEGLSEAELNKLREFYARISQEAEKDDDIHNSHSIDAAEKLQETKDEIRKEGMFKKSGQNEH